VVDALLEETQGLSAGLEACTWLGRLGAAEATEPFLKMIRGWFTNRFLKVAAAGALAQMGHKEGEEALGRYLKARRKDMRGYAMEKVGELGLVRHRPALLASLRDARDYHADTAALALGALGQAEDLEALRQAATSGRADVRLEVARALRRLKPQGQVLARLCQDPDEDVRQVAQGLRHDSDALY
jgi:HEAT repeat protein